MNGMDVKCDNCGKIGHRQRKNYVPEGWLFAEVDIEGIEAILFACSEDCACLKWRKGPGCYINPDKNTIIASIAVPTLEDPSTVEIIPIREFKNGEYSV